MDTSQRDVAPDGDSSQWPAFFLNSRHRQPLGCIDEAVRILGGQCGLALDLGCGAGVDSRYLAQLGFPVHAIDVRPEAIISTAELCTDLPVQPLRENICNLVIPANQYHVILAWQTLPFIDASCLQPVVDRIARGLVPGGVFIFAVLGPEDSWAESSHSISFVDLETIRAVLCGMIVVELSERRFNGSDASGRAKYWHTIRGIAQKRHAVERGEPA